MSRHLVLPTVLLTCPASILSEGRGRGDIVSSGGTPFLTHSRLLLGQASLLHLPECMQPEDA